MRANPLSKFVIEKIGVPYLHNIEYNMYHNCNRGGYASHWSKEPDTRALPPLVGGPNNQKPETGGIIKRGDFSKIQEKLQKLHGNERISGKIWGKGSFNLF